MRNNSFIGLFTIVLLWFFILPSGIKDRPNIDGQTINCVLSESSSDSENESISSNKQLISTLYVETVNTTVHAKTSNTNNGKIQTPGNVSYKKNSSTNVQISNYLLYTNSLHSTNHIKLQRFNI